MVAEQVQAAEGRATPPRKANIVVSASGVDARYAFSPKPDITPIELAHCVALLICGVSVSVDAIPASILDVLYGQMAPESARHFIVREKPEIVLPG